MRAELPVGTVTFLFTDIEGSIRLIEALGEDGYVNALGEHQRVLRDVSVSSPVALTGIAGSRDVRGPVVDAARPTGGEKREVYRVRLRA